MHLASRLDDTLADEGVEPELLRDAYRSTLKELRDATVGKTGRLYYLRLWRSLAPEGSIYHLNGLLAEHLKHCADLWDQLRVLATKHEAILGRENVDVEDRANALHAALLRTQVLGSPEVVQTTTAKITVKRFKVTEGDKKMDPFVEIRYVGKCIRTAVKRDAGLEATWNETVGPFPLVSEQNLTCCVLDFDRCEDGKVTVEKVGTTHRLRLEDLVRDSDGVWEGSIDLFKESADHLQKPCGQLALRIQFEVGRGGGYTTGFKPLEEFLGDKVMRVGPLLVPQNPEARSTWLYGILIANLVLLIQFVAPTLIVMDKWFSDRNKLQHPHEFLNGTGLDAFWCPARPMTDTVHTLMGVLLLTLILVIVSSYISQQLHSADKEARSPTDKSWQFLGAIANLWCCAFTALAAPLDFWVEDNATTIAMNSMALLFIFSLDDLSGVACSFFGKDDEDFRRAASWNMALLSRCPVMLSDLVNPHATGMDDFWIFRHGPRFGLRAVGDQGLDAEAAPLRDCEVRLSPAPKDEGSALLSDDREFWHYRNHSKAAAELLPRLESRIIHFLWKFEHMLMLLATIVFPFLWVLADKPCNPPAVVVLAVVPH